MNNAWRKSVFLLVGCAAAATIGVAALFGVVGQPRADAPTPTAVAMATPARAALIQQKVAPTRTPKPTPAATPTPGPAVSVSLASFDQKPSLGGAIATFEIENHRSSALSFAFDPTYDVRLVDAHGKAWPLRWAAYDGSPKVAGNSSAQLARAFFAGPVGDAKSFPLTVSVERVPSVGKVTWKVSDHGSPTPVAVRSALQLPVLKPAGPVALTLANPQPNSALGGIQVDLMVHNAQSKDLVFQFDPNAQITAEDNLHRPYHVQWAQYAGKVHVGPHATVRLARVFFSGPIADAQASYLTVSLRQVPGATQLRNVIPLN